MYLEELGSKGATISPFRIWHLGGVADIFGASEANITEAATNIVINKNHQDSERRA